MSGALRTYYDQFNPDAPIQLQVLGNLLSPGLFTRAFAHMITALIGGYDPNFGEYDVTVRSPVLDLRQRFIADLSARLLSVAFALVAWQVFRPLGIETTVGPMATMAVQVYLVINIAVLAVDPVLFVVAQTRDT